MKKLLAGLLLLGGVASAQTFTTNNLTVNGVVTTPIQGIWYGNGSGILTPVTIGSNLTFSGGTLSANSSATAANLNTATTIVNVSAAAAPTTGQVLTAVNGTTANWQTPGAGTVTSASVVSANGFAGTVATPTTTPAITLSTSITGMLKGNGTAISAGTAGTDYVAPGTATTFTAPMTFTNADLLLLGSSTGATTFNSANSSGSNYTLTFPAATDTVVTLNAAQALTNKTATTPPVYDNSTSVATTAFASQFRELSARTVPLSSITGGQYSFASNGVNATVTYTVTSGAITSVTSIAAGGSGYVVGDLISVTAGNRDAVLSVATVSAGAIATVTIQYGGTGYSNASAVATANTQPAHTVVTLAGVLASNATILSRPGTLINSSRPRTVYNNTTGAFTTTWKLSNGSDAPTGTGVVITQGTGNSRGTSIYSDGVNDFWYEDAGSIMALAGGSGLTVGTTTIASGTSGYIEYNNAGVLGEKAPTGTGSVVLANGPTITGSFTATGLVTLADIATQATNTIVGNATSGSASPTALAIGSCSGASNALIWTTNTGFGCNTISGSSANLYVGSSSGSPTTPTVGAFKGQVAIGDGASVSSTGLASMAIGTGASNNASSTGGMAIGWNAVVSGAFSAHAIALGNSYASGTDSFAAANADNSGTYGALGANSIAIGQFAKATSAANGTAIGPTSLSSAVAAVAIGQSTIAGGTGSVALGGYTNSNQAAGNYSLASGGSALASYVGQEARASSQFAIQGDAQISRYTLHGTTTNATATTIYLDGSAAQIGVLSTQAVGYRARVVAHDVTTVANNAVFSSALDGVVFNNAGTLANVSPTTSTVQATNSWTTTGMAITFSVSGTNLVVQVQGPAATTDTIHWVVEIETVEVRN